MAKLIIIIEFSDTLMYKINSMVFFTKIKSLMAILAKHSFNWVISYSINCLYSSMHLKISYYETGNLMIGKHLIDAWEIDTGGVW